MRATWSALRLLWFAAALASGAFTAFAQLPSEPLHEAGQSVTGAFEGWFRNPDGTYSFLAGYFNRNVKEELDIPIGPNNNIEPGGPDQGQPTHFLPHRQWGVFTVTVPANFGDKKLTWTLVAHGKKTEIPMSLNPLWEISPFHEEGMGNTPPFLRFEENGTEMQGPRALKTSLTARVGVPLPLNVWVSDDAKTFPNEKPPNKPAVTVAWSKYRGPGAVAFSPAQPKVEQDPSRGTAERPFAGKASTSAIFSQPGDYVLLVVLNDWSGVGGGGFQCCWTVGEVSVSVKP